MKLASKKCALLTRAKRQAAISSKRSAAMKLNPYVSPKLFENEALWQLTTIGWRMLNIACKTRRKRPLGAGQSDRSAMVIRSLRNSS